MNKDQALLLALSALYDSIPGSPEWIATREQAAAAIQEVIDPSQLDLVRKRYSFDRRGWKHPAPRREWVGLTDEQFLEASQLAEDGNYMVAFQRIQQWLREKNV